MSLSDAGICGAGSRSGTNQLSATSFEMLQKRRMSTNRLPPVEQRRMSSDDDVDTRDSMELQHMQQFYKREPFIAPSVFPDPRDNAFLFEPVAARPKILPRYWSSLPDLSKPWWMIKQPDFLPTQYELMMDNSVYKPYVLRTEFIIRSKFRCTTSILLPPPRRRSEGDIVGITFTSQLNKPKSPWARFKALFGC